MGKPAARMGDMTMHGGTIMTGFPTVMIGKKPAARVGDSHVCPMLNPGTPPPPHVGMVILPPGVPTVLIGKQPAACVGDMVACAGPPDTIAPPGCPTVFIGAGGGGGAGAGFGMAGSASGSTSAPVGTEGSGEGTGQSDTDSDDDEIDYHSLYVDFKDKGGYPISGMGYKVDTADGRNVAGVLTGFIDIALDNAGDSKIELIGVTRIKWSEKKVKIGSDVKLQVETVGIDSGTKAVLKIFVRNQLGSPQAVKEIESKVQGDKIEESWTTEISDELVKTQRQAVDKGVFSTPYHYFTVAVDGFNARSGLLLITDDVKIRLLDEEDQPVPDAQYLVLLPNGEIRQGTLSNGEAEEKDMPAGVVMVQFPSIPLQDE
jgi:uncharacterized Zn-binding protein involved in type VI secretion